MFVLEYLACGGGVIMKRCFTKYSKGLTSLPNDPKMMVEYLLRVFRQYVVEKEQDAIGSLVLMDSLGQVFNFLSICSKHFFAEKNVSEEFHMDYVITLLFCIYSDYAFAKKANISQEIMIDGRKITDKEFATILVDYLNYILEINGYERRFTVMDLYSEYVHWHHKADMGRLRSFIMGSARYYNRLKSGTESIDDIYREFSENNGLHHISKSGSCYYTKEMKELVGAKEIKMPDDKTRQVMIDIDEMACAYYRYEKESGEYGSVKTKIIPSRIKAMRTRDNGHGKLSQ